MLEVLAAALTTFLSAPLTILLGKRLRIEGVDVHKPRKPIIPKTGGLAIILGSLLGITVSMSLHGWWICAPILAACLIASVVGFIEDVRGEVDPRIKPLLLVFASLPILLLGAYYPRPVVPFLGRTRLYKVYPLLVVAAYPIVCNAVNSLDVLNGSAILTSTPFLLMSVIILYLRGDYPLMMTALVFFATAVALLPYNFYPAKTFIGNSGSLFIGAAITSIAIAGGIEIAAIIALIPQIMNEMYVIFSIRGLKSAKRVEKRPLRIEEGFLTASEDKDSPITLLRMLCAGVKVDERKAVYAMTILSIFAAVLGLLTDVFLIEGWM